MNYKQFQQKRLNKRASKHIILILACVLLVSFVVAAQTSSPTPQPIASPAASPEQLPSPPLAPSPAAATPAVAISPAPSPAAMPQSAKQSASSASPGKRNLAIYDKGGQFTITKGASRAAREAAMSQVRRFLFEHWQGKHHGYVQTFHPDIAGNAVSSVFFIEPDAKGQWAITIERADSSETFHFVEQVSVPNDGTPPRVDPDGKVRGSGGTGLYLKQNAKAHSGLIL